MNSDIKDHSNDTHQEAQGLEVTSDMVQSALAAFRTDISPIEAMHAALEAALKSAPVVMPERSTDTDWLRSNDEYNEGWNDCLDEVARLNGIKP